MKVIDSKTEAIALSEIDPSKHFIVAKINGNPCIGHQDWGVKDKFRFYCLTDNFTRGNHFLKIGSIQTVVRNMLKEGAEVEIFCTYRDALRWLIAI